MPGHSNWFSLDFADHRAACTFDFSSFNELSKREAIEHTITQIIKDFGSSLYVSISGGMDSEFVAKCLLEHGVVFTPVIVDYVCNGAEVWNAYYWCRENNLRPMVIKLNDHHMKTVLPYYALKNKTTYVSAIDYIVDQMIDEGGKIITGSPEPFMREDCLEDRLDHAMSDQLYISTYDFSLENAYPGKHPGSFFTYTPEMLVAMVRDLDYSKPVQLALAEFYGVRPRPKVPAAVNTAPYQEIALQVNRAVPLYAIDLGAKDALLAAARSHSVFECTKYSPA